MYTFWDGKVKDQGHKLALYENAYCIMSTTDGQKGKFHNH